MENKIPLNIELDDVCMNGLKALWEEHYSKLDMFHNKTFNDFITSIVHYFYIDYTENQHADFVSVDLQLSKQLYERIRKVAEEYYMSKEGMVGAILGVGLDVLE